MNLQRVRGNGCILYYPPTLPNSDLLRGGKGYVVDLDAPLEREWCKAQMHLLEPAPAGSVANVIHNKAALRAIQDHKTRAAQPAPKAEPELELVATCAPSDIESLRVTRPAKGKA